MRHKLWNSSDSSRISSNPSILTLVSLGFRKFLLGLDSEFEKYTCLRSAELAHFKNRNKLWERLVTPLKKLSKSPLTKDKHRKKGYCYELLAFVSRFGHFRWGTMWSLKPATNLATFYANRSDRRKLPGVSSAAISIFPDRRIKSPISDMPDISDFIRRSRRSNSPRSANKIARCAANCRCWIPPSRAGDTNPVDFNTWRNAVCSWNDAFYNGRDYSVRQAITVQVAFRDTFQTRFSDRLPKHQIANVREPVIQIIIFSIK